jgi:predicted metal-binding membrane protein
VSVQPSASGTAGGQLRRFDRGLLLPAVLVVAAGAWLLLILGSDHVVAPAHEGHVAGGHVHGEAHGDTAAAGTGALTSAGLIGWFLMVVAMMLPPALPLLRMLQRLVARHRSRQALVLSGVASFLAVWMLLGVLLVTGDAILTALTEGTWRPAPQVLVGGVLLLAGAFQLSPLKSRCLIACRSPRSFAVAHWHGERHPAIESAAIGAAYGASCVGCCWALMLVCFAGGTAHLATMVPLTVLMTAERMTPFGTKLVRPIGVAALATGAALLAVPLLGT